MRCIAEALCSVKTWFIASGLASVMKRKLINCAFYATFVTWLVYSFCVLYLLVLPYIVPICLDDKPNDVENPGFCMINSMRLIAIGAGIDLVKTKVVTWVSENSPF